MEPVISVYGKSTGNSAGKHRTGTVSYSRKHAYSKIHIKVCTVSQSNPETVLCNAQAASGLKKHLAQMSKVPYENLWIFLVSA